MAAPVKVYGPPKSPPPCRGFWPVSSKKMFLFNSFLLTWPKANTRSPTTSTFRSIFNFISSNPDYVFYFVKLECNLQMGSFYAVQVTFLVGTLLFFLICEQPFGQVPAFQDESITLFESRAISRYICNKYANQGNKGLYGTNPLEKASIDQWLEAEGQNFNPPSSILVFQLAFAPRMKIKQDENLIKQNEAKLAKVLDVYDKRLEESRYLAGDDFTLADLSHLPNGQYLVNATDRGELFTSRKNVERWWGEISSRESWKKVVEMQKSPSPKSA
ncbi:hypothetical protein DH2020_007451 [Rehmannia glutinosa]|uniref:glutathione transferase n=1 Tax=Rehmannia glutinosa TaxID=99300 RepID=A0ABR0TYW2_REHGL